jgi:hypothetical protein
MSNVFSRGIVGVFDFDINEIDFSNPLFLKTSEYLPIASLLGSVFSLCIPMSGYVTTMNNDKRNISAIEDKLNGIKRLFNGTGLPRYSSLPLARVLGRLSENIREYLEAPSDMTYNFDKTAYSRTSYALIAGSFFSIKFKNYYLQSMKKLTSGKGTVCDKDGRIIMGMVFKSELLKYHKLYFLINGDFDYANMEFWINYEIDTPQYPYKGFRKMYRNVLKPMLREINIPFVEKGDVDISLRASFSVPQNSIREMEEWKTNLLTGFLNEEAENVVFQF